MINLSKPSITNSEIEEVSKVLESNWLGMGKYAHEFERECKRLIGCKHFISLSSGTRALETALVVSGCKHGDEVLVPSNTYQSAIQVILKLSLIPVFVDSDPSDLNISIEDLERKITKRTRFIMPVHFRGRSCRMDLIREIAEKNNLIIIEDAAHAFGSKYQNELVGGNSFMACFSFGPIKNITCGSGGGIATNDDSIAKKILIYRNMGVDRSTWERFSGGEKKHSWEIEVTSAGDRCHLSDLNASIGLAQLSRLGELKKKKEAIIRNYELNLGKIPGISLLDTDVESDFLYIYVILVPEKDRHGLMVSLFEKGIHSGIHYAPNHLQPLFRKFSRGSLPIIEEMASRYLTLPSYNDLSSEDQNRVIEAISSYFCCA